MSQATLTTKGQVTIPKAVREQLDLEAGDQIDFIVGCCAAASGCTSVLTFDRAAARHELFERL